MARNPMPWMATGGPERESTPEKEQREAHELWQKVLEARLRRMKAEDRRDMARREQAQAQTAYENATEEYKHLVSELMVKLGHNGETWLI